MTDLTIISGGQTGADQGGLFAAAAEGIETGGWATKGWRTDDGPAPWLADFHLQESRFAAYNVRTIANVRMCEAVIWIGNPYSPGGQLTLGTAHRLGRLCVVLSWPVVSAFEPMADLVHVRTIVEWLRERHLRRIMVAGNRERKNPGIKVYTKYVIRGALVELAKGA